MSETTSKGPLSPDLLAKMDAYWRAANYLSVGQIYLKDNPLLERPLTLDDVKPRLLGHWGTTPGLNFLYVHWNRIIRERNLDMMYIIGPGHGEEMRKVLSDGPTGAQLRKAALDKAGRTLGAGCTR